MYYPVGWHKVLKLDTRFHDHPEPSAILSVQANHERELLLILTTRSLHIWFPQPAAEIVCHRRSRESIDEIGFNRSAVWRPDSSAIVVATDRDQLLFFQLRRRLTTSAATAYLLPSSSDGDSIYRLKHNAKAIRKMLNNELLLSSAADLPDQIPALTISSFGKLNLSAIGVSCLMSAEEELIVGTRSGDMYGVHWTGNVDEKFPWSLSKEVSDRGDFLTDLKFSKVLAGFAMVFRSGRIGFMPLRIERQENGSTGNQDDQTSSNIGVYATNISYLSGVKNAKKAEINHRYRLVAFGLKDSKIVVCSIGEANSLVVNHTLDLANCKYSHHMGATKLGQVECLRYSPDNYALVTAWSGGHFAIWSVFGALLWCSQQWQPTKPLVISSLDWGREGYSLATVQEAEIRMLSLARCNLSTSPHLTCSSDAVVLMTEGRLYVGPSVPHEDKFDHWIVINLPQDYSNEESPIRYATVDRNCEHLAVAGTKGMAIYSIATRRWISFAKKSPAKNFSICGDLIWWRNYLIVSCFNFENGSFELRAYKTAAFAATDSLNNSPNTIVQATKMEIIRMSIFENRLLVLYGDGSLSMFMLNLRLRPDSSDVTLQIAPIENLVISNLQANPFCISAIALTRLHFSNSRHDDSILLNVCGKLFLLEREQARTPASKTNVTFKAVSVIATNVEQFWISPEISDAPEMSYFKKSLWLSCGQDGSAASSGRLQVWLPLLNDKKDPPTNIYVPDRIMLPIKCDIYPLAIRSSSSAASNLLNATSSGGAAAAATVAEPGDVIVLGAESDVLYKDCKLFEGSMPYLTVKRQCRVYLHKILRELLLNQHLGYYAKKIAESCQSLPYFAHCFELLLHEVLEEEATSPRPVPDPMLPQIVKFIKEFPVYLETVVHCARKSDMSMWSHLFDERAVGDPQRLFQECIEQRKLDTAASCLIILQSLDKSIVSSRMVRDLIGAARESSEFAHLVDDLQDFLIRAELENRSASTSPASSQRPPSSQDK